MDKAEAKDRILEGCFALQEDFGRILFAADFHDLVLDPSQRELMLDLYNKSAQLIRKTK